MRTDVVPELVFTIDGVLTPEECARYIAVSEGTGYSDAPITTELGPQMLPDVRNNTRVIVDDVTLAASLWPRIAPHVRPIDGTQPLGLNERFRFYRYDPGQVFAWHYDGAYRRPNGERSQLTLMVYLNDGFSGGETSFAFGHPWGELAVVPKAGMALLFIHHVLHEGARIRSGRKYVLRSDVMFTPPESRA